MSKPAPRSRARAPRRTSCTSSNTASCRRRSIRRTAPSRLARSARRERSARWTPPLAANGDGAGDDRRATLAPPARTVRAARPRAPGDRAARCDVAGRHARSPPAHARRRAAARGSATADVDARPQKRAVVSRVVGALAAFAVPLALWWIAPPSGLGVEGWHIFLVLVARASPGSWSRSPTSPSRWRWRARGASSASRPSRKLSPVSRRPRGSSRSARSPSPPRCSGRASSARR